MLNVYEFIKNDTEKSMLSLDSLLENSFSQIEYIDLKDRPLVVFGAGVAGRTLVKRLVLNNIIPKFIIDEYAVITSFLGIPVIDPNTYQIENDIKQNARLIISIIPECSFVKYLFDDLLSKVNVWGFKNIYKIDFYYYQISQIFIGHKSSFSRWQYFDRIMGEVFVRNRELVSEALKSEHALIAEAYNLFEDACSRDVFLSGIKFFYEGNKALPVSAISKQQYFISELYDFDKVEIAVDAGAYTGDTALQMINLYQNLRMLYCFEPSPTEYELLVESMSKTTMESYCLMAGLGGKTCISDFTQDIHLLYEKSNDYVASALIVALDDFMHGVEPDLIKMDIEGSEKQALIGAQRIIKKYEPLLVICVYHHPEDLWEIPAIINDFGVEYRYYLRRHSLFSWNETVCYAVPKRFWLKS